MRHVIHKLRQKPDHYKRGVAVAVSSAFTLLLVAIWGVTLPVRYADLFGNKKADTQQASVIASSPLDSIKASLNQNFSDLKTQVANGSGVLNASADTTVTDSNGVVITDSNASSDVQITDSDSSNSSATDTMSSVGEALNTSNSASPFEAH